MHEKIRGTAAFIGSPLPIRSDLSESHMAISAQLTEMLIREIDRCIHQAGCTRLYCGAVPGPGVLCGEMLLAARADLPSGTELICTIPYRNHASHFSRPWQRRTRDLLRRADRIVQISQSGMPGVISLQNQFMIHRSQQVFVLGSSMQEPEAVQAMQYAMAAGRRVTFIDMTGPILMKLAGHGAR